MRIMARDHINLFGSQQSLEQTKIAALGWCILKQKKDCEKMETLGDLEKLASLDKPSGARLPPRKGIASSSGEQFACWTHLGTHV